MLDHPFFAMIEPSKLEDNKIVRSSTQNEGKAVVIERWNRTLKGRMWRYFSVFTLMYYQN